MKKLIIAISAIGALTFLGFTTIQKQEAAEGPEYITVSYTTDSNRIYTYAGGTPLEPVKFKQSLFGDGDYRDKIMDVLNDLYKQGYEVVSTDNIAYRDGNRQYDVIEYNYLLKKDNRNK